MRSYDNKSSITPEGGRSRLLQTNTGLHIEITPKGSDKWTTYSFTYQELVNMMNEEIKGE